MVEGSLCWYTCLCFSGWGAEGWLWHLINDFTCILLGNEAPIFPFLILSIFFFCTRVSFWLFPRFELCAMTLTLDNNDSLGYCCHYNYVTAVLQVVQQTRKVVWTDQQQVGSWLFSVRIWSALPLGGFCWIRTCLFLTLLGNWNWGSVCVCEREGGRERVCVCVCVWGRERVCICGWFILFGWIMHLEMKQCFFGCLFLCCL